MGQNVSRAWGVAGHGVQWDGTAGGEGNTEGRAEGPQNLQQEKVQPQEPRHA